MICDGCIVQGFYPHDCQQEIEVRVTAEGLRVMARCYCSIERGCGKWPEEWAEGRGSNA